MLLSGYYMIGTARAQSSSFDLEGHRGARGLFPENTLPAFMHALELGVTTLEMDVVITSDEQVVVSHDPWMSGTFCSLPSGEPVPEATEQDFRIFGMTYAEVVRFDCGLRGNPRFPQQQRVAAVKPLLRDVIEAAETYTNSHHRIPVQYNIETKSLPSGDGLLNPTPEVFTRLLYKVLVETGVKKRTIMQSFDLRTLRFARSLDPTLRLSLLVEEKETDMAANLARLGFTPAVYSPDYHLVDHLMLSEAHGRGMQVIPWTVNTLAEMQRLKAMGVDGLITDYPDVGRALLTANPQTAPNKAP